MGNTTQNRRLRRKCDCRNIERVIPQRTCPTTQPPTVTMMPSPTSTVTVAPSSIFLPMGK